MKIKTQKEWEADLKHRFTHTEIIGTVRTDGTIGLNLNSIADCFIEEFRKRLKQLKIK